MDVPPHTSATDHATFFEMAPDAFVVTDYGGCVLAVNEAARDLIDRPVADGCIADELFSHIDRPHVLRALRSLVQATSSTCDLRVALDGDREPRPVWVRAGRIEWGSPPQPSVLWVLRSL